MVGKCDGNMKGQLITPSSSHLIYPLHQYCLHTQQLRKVACHYHGLPAKESHHMMSHDVT